MTSADPPAQPGSGLSGRGSPDVERVGYTVQVVGPISPASTRGATPRPTAADQAWDAVVAFVTSAPEGTRLPPERAFAERLGVSRSTLRSAIARLELLGLVEVRHGSGIVVRRPDLSRQLALLFSAAGSGGELAVQALELRELVEPQLAAAAARRRAALPVTGTDEGAFHRALAAAGANELAGALVEALVGLCGETALPEALHAAQHGAVAAAIAVGDDRAAREAMALHLRSLRRAGSGRR